MFLTLKPALLDFGKIGIKGNLPSTCLVLLLIAAALYCVRQKKSLINKQPYHRKENIFCVMNSNLEIWIASCVVPLLLLVLFNKVFSISISALINKVDVISNNIIGLTAIAMTMSVVIFTLDKDYYIVFSKQEVLQKYRIREWVVLAFISCVAIVICTMITLDLKVDCQTANYNRV